MKKIIVVLYVLISLSSLLDAIGNNILSISIPVFSYTYLRQNVGGMELNKIPILCAGTNDDCQNAIAVVCGETVTGNTTFDTDSNGNNSPDEFFSFNGNGNTALVTVSFCDGLTDYDSYVRVYSDCTFTNEIASNDDFCGLQSQVSFNSDGTSTYIILVEGYDNLAGNFSMNINCIPTPQNDICSNAFLISCGDLVSGTTVDATPDTNESGDCGTSIDSPGVWYTITDNSGFESLITLDFCNGNTVYDNKVSVFSGSCGNLTCVAGNDDFCGLQSRLSFTTDGFSTYYILVHGYNGLSGTFEMNVSCAIVGPPNDYIVNSIDVDEIGFPYTDANVSTPTANLENGNPTNCDLTGLKGIWYNFYAPQDGTAAATISSPAGDSMITFYTAPTENSIEIDLTLVDQPTNLCEFGTSASINTTAGTIYYIFVMNTGSFTDIIIDGTNLGIAENKNFDFEYYPNPIKNVLSWKSSTPINRMAVYNILGEKVKFIEVQGYEGYLSLDELATGTYLLEVLSIDGYSTFKLIKE